MIKKFLPGNNRLRQLFVRWFYFMCTSLKKKKKKKKGSLLALTVPWMLWMLKQIGTFIIKSVMRFLFYRLAIMSNCSYIGTQFYGDGKKRSSWYFQLKPIKKMWSECLWGKGVKRPMCLSKYSLLIFISRCFTSCWVYALMNLTDINSYHYYIIIIKLMKWRLKWVFKEIRHFVKLKWSIYKVAMTIGLCIFMLQNGEFKVTLTWFLVKSRSLIANIL